MLINFSKLARSVISFVVLFFLASTVETIRAEDTSGLKKLFYTSSERKKIDLNRFKAAKKSDGEYGHKDKLGNGLKSKEVLETVSVEGFIKREDGNNVIWYNNTNTLDSNIGSDVKFNPASIVNNRINVVSRNRKIKLKPGQVLQLMSGKIQEQYKIVDSSAKLKIEKQ